MADALTILTSSSVSGALTLALIWFTRSWISERLKNAIKHEYDQKLVAFQAQVKAAHDIQLERLRADLQIAASERQIRYQKLHDRVAETVAQTYALLQRLKGTVTTYVSDLKWSSAPSDDELRAKIGAAIKEFRDYYPPRRIYLPQDIAKKVDDFAMKLSSITRQQTSIQEGQGKMSHDRLWEQANKIAEMMDKEIPHVFGQLESEFRKLLGSKTDA
jgi:hypothetical protein